MRWASWSKTVMNSLPDDLALRFGIGHARQASEEALAGVHGDQMQAEFVAQGLLDFLEFCSCAALRC